MLKPLHKTWWKADAWAKTWTDYNDFSQRLLVLFAMPIGRQVTSSDVLYSLHWLPVRRRIEFKTATLCFKAVQLSNPPYLKNMLKPYEPLQSLRSSTMDLLMVPWTDTSFGLRRFSIAAPRIRNGLPHEPRQCNTTLPCFKSHLKTLPPSHGQLAPHSQVAPPIAFFMTKFVLAK